MEKERLKVLVADDSLSDRMILQSLVSRLGHEVIPATDGQEALELFQADTPDIVLLDALMPRMDGFEVAQAIKENGSEDLIPIIFLTSLSDAESLARCLQAGGDDFLSKPYNPVILEAKINAMNRMRQMHATLQRQRDQIAEHNKHMLHEQQVAKSVFDNVAHNGCLDAPNIKHLLSPLSVFNGDVLLACMKPGGGMHVLIGDFTGHGLPAAIGAMPLAEIFYGMTRKGFALGDVLREINRKLKLILPVGFFCCAAMVDLDFDQESAEVWIGGLPELMLCRGDETVALKSNHLPLGILSADGFKADAYRFEMRHGDRLYLWSDGIIEAENPRGEMYGDARLRAQFKDGGDNPDLFDKLRDDVIQFIGSGEASDDLTLVELKMVPGADMVSVVENTSTGGVLGPRDWTFSYELRGDSLKSFDPVPVVMNLVLEVPELRSRSGDIYTILTEFYSNALEHGLLGLDSALKRSPDGFAEYYHLRGERLERLSEAFLSFTLKHTPLPDGGELTIDVLDSGQGFDVEKVNQSLEQAGSQAFSGRGIPLIRRLCQRVEYSEGGRKVVAVYQWQRERGKA